MLKAERADSDRAKGGFEEITKITLLKNVGENVINLTKITGGIDL